MYDNPNMPYRCPKCLQPVSSCTSDALTKKKTCGCMTCNCDAPVFKQSENESIYAALIKWNNWVINYRKNNTNWHRDAICKGCINENDNCPHYESEFIRCPKWKTKELIYE